MEINVSVERRLLRDLFDCPWFAPEIEKTNVISARRLAAYLASKQNITIIERNRNDRKLIDIVIEIKNGDKTKMVENLFCGDVTYDAVKNIIWNTRTIGYDNLVVLHHGSKMKYSALKIKKNSIAIVCGNKGTFRPADVHRNALEYGGNGYIVLVTEDASNPWID